MKNEALIILLESYAEGKEPDSFGADVSRKPRGFWNEKSVVAEAEKIVKQYGYLPCQKELRNLGLDSLASAIDVYSSFPKVRMALGLAVRKRENGYWQNWDNLQSELERITAQLGHFPSSDELKRKKYRGIYYAILKYHNGMPAVQKKLGELAPIKTVNYWKDFKHVLYEARAILKKTRRKKLPSSVQLRKSGYSSFCAAVSRHPGGFETLRRTLGEEPLLRKRGYWSREENLIIEIKKAMEKEGWTEVPSKTLLEKKGYRDISNAVGRHGKGFRELRRLLHQSQVKTEDGVWKDFMYVKERIDEAMAAEGWEQLPNADVLRSSGYNGIANAISRYHNGYRVFREKLQEYMGRPLEGGELASLLEEYAGGNNE